MKAIITGSSGMLGGRVLRALRNQGWDAEGWSHTTEIAPDGTRFSRIELEHLTIAEGAVRSTHPDLVVHCAAITDADDLERGRPMQRAEKQERARVVNAKAPEVLARAAKDCGARFVYVSTDAVYDGEKPGLRREDEKPNPLSVYAKTKWEGEERVLSAYPEALILRTTMFGWTLPGHREKFVEEILRALYERRPLHLFADATFSPLSTTDLAPLLIKMAAKDIEGVYNLGAIEPISKYAFGHLVAQTFDLDLEGVILPAVVSDGKLQAPRARNTGLDVSRAAEVLGFQPPTVRESLLELAREVQTGEAEVIRGRPLHPHEGMKR